MNRYDLVIFDFDGTLMNTKEGVAGSAGYTLRKYGLADLSDKELEVFIGPPFNVQIGRMFDLTEEKIWEITNDFRTHYSEVNLLKADYYDGILETIDALRDRGIKVATGTYKRCDYAEKISEAYHFTERMDAIEGCDFVGKLTKTDIIRNCIEKCGIRDLSRVLMVGDTMNDALGANELGIDFAGALYGFGLHTEEEKEESGAVFFIKAPAELLEYI